MKSLKSTLVGGLTFAGIAFAAIGAVPNIAAAAGCVGACGTDVANGDVTLPPGFSSYQFVTTNGGTTGGGNLPSVFGSPGVDSTNGSTFTTASFTTTPGELVDFQFNYITSDGSGFPDYAWAGLMSTTGGTNYLIFSAQTQPTGDTVPGSTLPALAPGASLTPPASPITPGSGTSCSPLGSGCNTPPGGPVWAELGGSSSGDCFAVGCGLTGWIESQFNGEAAGTYVLEFGVSNTNDTIFDSGLAFAGVEAGGNPVGTPEPSTWALMLVGLAGLGLVGRRRLQKDRTASASV
jgi:hypothetical protein